MGASINPKANVVFLLGLLRSPARALRRFDKPAHHKKSVRHGKKGLGQLRPTDPDTGRSPNNLSPVLFTNVS